MERNGSRRLLKPAKGTHDFVNEQMIIRGEHFQSCQTFSRDMKTSEALFSRGKHFQFAGAPALETRDTHGKTRGGKKIINCDLAGQGGKPCCLKYEPFVRQEAMIGMASFKRCQISKVYRRDNPSKVRYQEF
jgi:histidyl-tRNA synthetase|uniref:Uncharacterized protein n=1 Tax=Populus trichocarpa TaxID=3694 RepID=B9N199_POPTR